MANSVIVAICWFERDVSDDTLIENPFAYLEGSQNWLLNKYAILKTAIRSLLHAGFIFIGCFVLGPQELSLAQLGKEICILYCD